MDDLRGAEQGFPLKFILSFKKLIWTIKQDEFGFCFKFTWEKSKLIILG